MRRKPVIKLFVPLAALIILLSLLSVGNSQKAGLLGKVEPFATSSFCKTYGCSLDLRDDKYYGVDILFIYSLSRDPDIKIHVLRRVDTMYDVKLRLKNTVFPNSNSRRQLIKDLIYEITGEDTSKDQIENLCGKSLSDKKAASFSTISSTQDHQVLCISNFQVFLLRISNELLPIIRPGSHFLYTDTYESLQEGNLSVLSSNKTGNVPDYAVNVLYKNGKDIAYISATKMYPYVGQDSVAWNLQQLKSNIVKVPGQPLGEYSRNVENTPIRDLMSQRRVFLQTNFKAIQSGSLRGIRFMEFVSRDEGGGRVFPERSLFRYEFLGFTRDGKYYVKISATSSANFLPKSAPQPPDSTSFNEIKDMFLVIGDKLNSTKETDFTPALSDLDDLFSRVSFQ
jgi:hypothetical protein